MQAAIDFVDENRLAIERMIVQGAVVKKALKSGSADSECAQFPTAVEAFDSAVPKVGEVGNSDPLVQSLADVSGAYYEAALFCDSKKDLRSYMKKADAAIKKAESLAKEYGTHL